MFCEKDSLLYMAKVLVNSMLSAFRVGSSSVPDELPSGDGISIHGISDSSQT